MKEPCNSILDFQNGHFIICKLDHKHKGPHTGLNFKWEGGDLILSDTLTHSRGKNLFKLHLQKITKEILKK